MKLILLALTGFTFCAVAATSYGQRKSPAQATQSSTSSAPVLATEAEWKEVFTFWPMPFIEPALVDNRYRLSNIQPLGLYRLSLDPQGNVTEIKILQRMGPPFDTVALKALINWKARPGSSRMVTIFLRYGQKHRVATATIREWGFAPGRW